MLVSPDLDMVQNIILKFTECSPPDCSLDARTACSNALDTDMRFESEHSVSPSACRQLAGWLYLPKQGEHNAGADISMQEAPFPVVIMAHGLGAQKDFGG